MLVTDAPGGVDRRWQDDGVALTGIWLLLSPPLLGFGEDVVAVRSVAVCGIALLLLSIFGSGHRNQQMRMLAGASLAGAPLAFRGDSLASILVAVGSGLIVIAFARSALAAARKCPVAAHCSRCTSRPCANPRPPVAPEAVRR